MRGRICWRLGWRKCGFCKRKLLTNFTRKFFWKDLQEQRFKEELDLLEKKHRLETKKKERERARVLKRKEMPVVTGAVTSTTSCSLSPSFEPNGEVSTPSKDELSLDREKSWWNADLEGRMDKLAVKYAVTSSANGSKNLDGKADRWSAGVAITFKEKWSETDSSRNTRHGSGHP